MEVLAVAPVRLVLLAFMLVAVLPHSTAAIRSQQFAAGTPLPAAVPDSTEPPATLEDPTASAAALASRLAAVVNAPSAPVPLAADEVAGTCSRYCFAACKSCYQQAGEYEELTYGYDYDHHLACDSTTGCNCSVCFQRGEYTQE